MTVGVVVMILAAVNYVPEIPARILEWSIYILNTIISRIASFEQFIIKGIPLNVILLITLYLFLLGLFIWLKNPDFRKLAIALCLLIIVQSCYAYSIYSEEKQNEWIVFHSVKSTLITEKSGRKISRYSNDGILKNVTENTLFKNYYTGHFCQSLKKEHLKNLYYFKTKKILVIDSSGVCPPNCKPDIILLTHSPKINLERLILTTHPKQIVADGSNYKKAVQSWKACCQKKKIPFHATAEKGFYKIE